MSLDNVLLGLVVAYFAWRVLSSFLVRRRLPALPKEGALAVGPGLHERRGWQPTLSLENDAGAMVGLEDLEAWWRRA